MITRREFELVARFVGKQIDPASWEMKGEPWLPLNKEYFDRRWAPHEPSSDACEVIARVEQYLMLPIQESVIPDSDALIVIVSDYQRALCSGDATQLYHAAFKLAVAIQEEREGERKTTD